MRALLLMLSIAVAGAARAEDVDAAKRYYALGTRLYDAGKYKDAAEAYGRSYAAKGDPSLLYYIGQSFRLAGMAEPALNAYRSFLDRQPRSPLRTEVEAHIAALEQALKPQPAPPPPPQPQPPPPPPAQAAPVAAPSPAPAADRPLYTRWWLWTAVAAVVVAGVAIGVGVAYALPNDAPAPEGAYTVRFP